MILPDTEETRARAAETVQRGGVVAFRTDTFYGLGADPMNSRAVRRIHQLKGREAGKPILVLIAHPNDLDRFIAERTVLFDLIVERHWPGPLTLVGRAQARLPRELTAGTATIGVRLPDDQRLREFVRHCGGALTATSANLSGQPPASTAQAVEDYFAEDIDLIIDNGKVNATEASTVLDVSGTQPRLIREGAVSRRELQATMGEIEIL